MRATPVPEEMRLGLQRSRALGDAAVQDFKESVDASVAELNKAIVCDFEPKSPYRQIVKPHLSLSFLRALHLLTGRGFLPTSV